MQVRLQGKKTHFRRRIINLLLEFGRRKTAERFLKRVETEKRLMGSEKGY